MAYSSVARHSGDFMLREPADYQVSIPGLIEAGAPLFDQGADLMTILVNAQHHYDLSHDQVRELAEGLSLAHPVAASDYLTSMIDSGQYDSSATLGHLQRMMAAGVIDMDALPAPTIDLIYAQLSQQDQAESDHIQREQKLAALIEWVKLSREAISDMVDDDAARLEEEAETLRAEKIAADAEALREQSREAAQAEAERQQAEMDAEMDDLSPAPIPIPRRSLLDNLTDDEIATLLADNSDWAAQGISVAQFRAGRASVLTALQGGAGVTLGGGLDRDALLAHHEALAAANSKEGDARSRLERARALGWNTSTYEAAHEEAHRDAVAAQGRLTELEASNPEAFILMDSAAPESAAALPELAPSMSLSELIRAGLDDAAALEEAEQGRFDRLKGASKTLNIDLAEFADEDSNDERRRMIRNGMREARLTGVYGSDVTAAADTLKEASRELASTPLVSAAAETVASISPTPFMRAAKKAADPENDEDYAKGSGLSPLSMDPTAMFGG